MRERRSRDSRKVQRIERWKKRAAMITKGSMMQLISARRQLSSSMVSTIKITLKPSLSSATMPCVRNEFSASTSLVRRVISRPTGLRSKKERLMCWRWLKMRMRMSTITRWPVDCMTKFCP
jgi:hypothetical protein